MLNGAIGPADVLGGSFDLSGAATGFALSGFDSFADLIAGASFDEIVERIRNTVPTSWINSCKVWPVVTAFSFTYIPIQYRSIFGGVIAIGWQTYLSLLNQRAAALELGELEGGVKNAVVMERIVEERREGLREKEAV